MVALGDQIDNYLTAREIRQVDGCHGAPVISRTQCASYCAAELRETARMPRKGKIMSRKEEITSGESIQNARIIPTTGCNDHFSNIFRPYVNLNGVKMNLLKVI